MSSFIKTSFPWADKHTLNKKLKMPKNIKLEVLDFPQFYGKPLEEVKKHLEENYASRLPDLRVMEQVWKNIDQYPELKKKDDWQVNFFFGSTLRNSNGDWNVPCVRWTFSEFRRRAYWLSHDWNSNYRVVLTRDSDLETLKSPASDSACDLRWKMTQQRLEALEDFAVKVNKVLKLN